MTWADFYLTCFAVGFLLSAISFVAGGMRWHLHLPHFPHAGVHGPAGPAAGGHGAGGHAAGSANNSAGARSGHEAAMSPFNFVTLTAFLAWFGGIGFLITRFSEHMVRARAVDCAGGGTVRRGNCFSVSHTRADFA